MLRRVADRLIETAARALDRAASRAMDAEANRTAVRAAVSHQARVAFLERIAREYPERPDREFFGPAATIEPVLRRVRSERGLVVVDATWPSAYVPYLDTVRVRYGLTLENQFALARLFVRGSGRPVAVLIHGYRTGHFAIEERLWPLAELDRAGFDVALFVLPFHARRAPPDTRVPLFPSDDPRITIEGFRQAVFDLRSLVRFLRVRGHARVGLFGMSLGGYTAALTATVEPELDFLVPLIPLACLADFAREQGSLGGRPEEVSAEHALLQRVYRVASPLALPPCIESRRVLVVAARADHITPVAHARKLATHFGASLHAWRGGHVLQVGRRDAFRRVIEFARAAC